MKGKQPAATVLGAVNPVAANALSPVSLVKGCFSPVAKTSYWNKRDVAVTFAATAGPMLIVPAIYDAGVEGSFTLIAQCQTPVSIVEFKPDGQCCLDNSVTSHPSCRESARGH